MKGITPGHLSQTGTEKKADARQASPRMGQKTALQDLPSVGLKPLVSIRRKIRQKQKFLIPVA